MAVQRLTIRGLNYWYVVLIQKRQSEGRYIICQLYDILINYKINIKKFEINKKLNNNNEKIVFNGFKRWQKLVEVGQIEENILIWDFDNGCLII